MMLPARLVLVLTLVGAEALPLAAGAQSPRMVRVDVQFQHTGTQSGQGVQGRGGVIITERGGIRPRGRLGAGSTDTRTQQSTGIFTLVQDGGESTLTVATQVPYPQLAFYRDYATGAGHLVRGTVFREVGTSLKVRANLLPGNHIRVRLTPSISWLSADGSGAIEFTEATTEVIVASGQPLVIGGSTTQTHAVTREILGIGARDGSSATTVILTATAQ
jgi:type II/III secretion system protein